MYLTASCNWVHAHQAVHSSEVFSSIANASSLLLAMGKNFACLHFHKT